MPERSLLAFAYSFPPATSAEAALSAKRFANLPGWKADVIAAEAEPDATPDRSLAAYADARMRSVTRVALPNGIPFGRLRTFSRIPDPLRYLSGRAVRAAAQRGMQNFDAMLSWSNWCSAHLPALRLKRRYPDLPWIAHFSDPWVDNPYVSRSDLEKYINTRLERQVMQAADRLAFTTPETVELVMAKYPAAWRAKAVVVPHGYEPALFSGERPLPAEGRRLLIRYLGNFYGARSPDLLFGAIAEALKRRPSLPGEVQFEIVGQTQVEPDRSAVRVLPAGLVILKPPVSYRESLRLMETADLLLVVDAPAERSVFLPSKLVDYLGSGRPIVALTPPGASARVLASFGCPVADPADPAAGGAALLSGIDLAAGWRPERAAQERYSAATTGAEMAGILEDMVTRRAV